MKKFLLFFAMSTLALGAFTACEEAPPEVDDQIHLTGTPGATGQNENGGQIMTNLQGNGMGEVFYPATVNRQELDGTIYERVLNSPSVTLQLSPLVPGEELAIMHTNHGDITLRFFPQEAPLAVENFKTQARNGVYDGLIFHRVIPGFMIQGGCPLGTGTGGQSIFPEGLGLERSFNLHHFRGALATAHAGAGRTIGSQFYIVQNDELNPNSVADFEYLINIQDEIIGEFSGGRHIYVRDVHPRDGLLYFIEQGGTPWLDWHWNPEGYGHTVFGHVVEGLSVVDSIVSVEAERNRPVEDVIIERISFIIYGE